MPKPRSSTTPRAKKSPPRSSPPEKLSSAPESVDGRRARGEQTRARILELATRTASVDGLNGLTFGQIAEAAGVSKGHLVALFGDREQLQLAVIDAAVELFRREVLPDVEAPTPPEQRLERICLGWFRYVERRVLPGGCLITSATNEFGAMSCEVRDRLAALRTEEIASLTALVTEIRERKTVKDDRPARAIVYDILAYRTAANVSAKLDDRAGFTHARERVTELVRSVVEAR